MLEWHWAHKTAETSVAREVTWLTVEWQLPHMAAGPSMASVRWSSIDSCQPAHMRAATSVARGITWLAASWQLAQMARETSKLEVYAGLEPSANRVGALVGAI